MDREGRTEPLPVEPPPAPTEPLPAQPGRSASSGITVLATAVLAALALCGSYIALGGFDYRPSGPDDPCKSRPWGSPQGVEQTAERYSLAAIDGAACELGVSREELIRALAGEQARKAFADDHGVTEAEVEDAVRAGLLRATDDAERAGALSGLAATGIRLAVKVMPMSVMVSLIDNAAKLFEGGDSGLGGLGGALDLLDGGSAGGGLPAPGDVPGRLGGGLTDRLKERLPGEVQQALPDDLGRRVEQGLDSLINP